MMRKFNGKLAAVVALAFVSGTAVAGEASKEGSSGAVSFDTLDANGDGRISKSEATSGMPGIDQHWSSVDADGDGYLDQSEFAKLKVGGASEE